MTFDTTWSDSELLIRIGGFGAVVCLGNARPGLVRRLRSLGIVTDVVRQRPADATRSYAVAYLSDYFERMSVEEATASLVALREWPVGKFVIDVDLTKVPEQVANRGWWENSFFDAGFRKSSDYYVANDYASLDDADRSIRLVMTAIADSALDVCPREKLLAERDLHMDMFRESGSRSDAHVFRYQWASQYVRPGDAVLDAACGLGYGSRLLADVSAAGEVTGIDGSPGAIEYAERMYAEAGRVNYAVGMLPECLAALPDGSFDVIVSFETLEHVPEPERVLAEFGRLLSPGGRIVASVPNDWSDETGRDPNPYHFHVYDYASFTAQLSRGFDLEEIWAQSADRAKKHDDRHVWIPQRRSISELGVHRTAPFEAEWLLAVAAKSPVAATKVPYREKLLDDAARIAGGNATAWGRDYLNPWLLKSMVSIGWATRNAELRTAWASRVIEQAPVQSADYGAALCVLLYAKMGDVDLVALAREFLAANARSPNENVGRWRVSIGFALAVKLMIAEDYEGAVRLFQEVTAERALAYHPTLLTKACDAAYLAGVVLMALGRRADALTSWESGYARVMQALNSGLAEVGRSIAQPEFVLRELAAVMAQLARLQALHRSHVQESSSNVRYIAARSDALSLIADGANWSARLGHAVTFANDRSAELQTRLDDVFAGKVWLERQWRDAAAQVAELSAEVERLKREAIERDKRGLLGKLRSLRS